jgi:transposase
MMILELHRQGVPITAIARRTGRDPKTIRKYIERGIEAPVYGPRSVGRPSKLAPYLDYLRERIAAFPDLSAVRLTREIREMGYEGAYTAGETLPGRDPPRPAAPAVRGPLRDTGGRAGTGGLRPLRRHVRR